MTAPVPIEDEKILRELRTRTKLPGQMAVAKEFEIGRYRAARLLAAVKAERGPVQDGGPVQPSGPVQSKLDRSNRRTGPNVRWLYGVAGTLASVVVIAPVSLSAQDLFRWASSKTGLGLTGPWPYVVFVGLDAAAALCICLTFISALRRESAGMAHLLVWVFAGMSAFANFNNGLRLLASGTMDAVWFFPAMSISGALLLEIVVKKVRQWSKASAGLTEKPTASFRLMRWIVAPGETRRAWIASIKEGIAEPRLAIEHVRVHDARTGDDRGARVDGLRISPEQRRRLLSRTGSR